MPSAIYYPEVEVSNNSSNEKIIIDDVHDLPQADREKYIQFLEDNTRIGFFVPAYLEDRFLQFPQVREKAIKVILLEKQNSKFY